MARVKFSEIQDRFTHIDARLVSYCCSFPEATALIEVDVYPWWEHPQFVQARRMGKPWGFTNLPDSAYKRIAVHAIGVREAKLSPCFGVTEWWTTQDDPLLWPYHQAAGIDCNQPLSLDAWLSILDDTCAALRLRTTEPISNYASIERIRRYGLSSCFSLGHFPRPVFLELRKQLEERGIEIFVASEPTEKDLPTLFCIDGGDYIIADGFEVDLPEFEHKAEWFKP